jgi:hypothetical protein
MWMAVLFFFSFYLPALLLAQAAPAASVLLYPCKLALVWIIWMGYEAASVKEQAAAQALPAREAVLDAKE